MINSRNFLKLMASMPFLGVGLLSSCDINKNDRVFRYIITVNVEAGDRVYSGSSVWQTKYHEQAINIIDTNRSETKGEAVVVDVNGKYLFLLVNLSMSGLAGKIGDNDAVNEFENNQSWEITDFKDYPFVTFSDISDPLTVKEITLDNFGQYFMGGKIINIKVQKTNEPVAYGKVEGVIPWIRDGITRDDNMHAKRPLFDEDEFNYPNGPPYNSLSVVQFIKT